MKKLIAFLISLTIVLSFASCKDKNAANNETPETPDNKIEASADKKVEEAKTDSTQEKTAKKDAAVKSEKTESKNETASVAEPVNTTESAPEVKMEENKIVNTTTDDSGNVTVQEFVYENDELSDINVTIKFDSEEEAKEYYEDITNGDSKEEFADRYESVELNGNCVQAEYKDEQVEPMKALAQDEMYLILNSSITTYEVKE